MIKGHRLLLDATVFPANITYPSDVKLLNSVRDYLCKTILEVKNGLNSSQKSRSYRRVGRKLFLNFQKKKRKTKQVITKTRKQMIQYVKRNISQLDNLLKTEVKRAREGLPKLPEWKLTNIKERRSVAHEILKQQT